MKTFKSNIKSDNKIKIIQSPSEVLKKGKISEFFKEKETKDEISFWIDDVLRRMFLANDSNYLLLAKVISGLNRIERRILSETALENLITHLKKIGIHIEYLD